LHRPPPHPDLPPSKAPAILATALALALINLGLAVLIVAALGVRTFAPFWVGALVGAVGMAAAGAAVVLWRRYLAARRRGF
jgi:hypothetical protein